MSQKAINERAIRVTTLENLNDHLRKMPGISGVTGVSKGDSQNDFDAISSSMGDVVSSQPGRRARSTRTSVQNEEKREIVVNAEAAAGIVKADDKKSRYEQKLSTERYKLEENNRLLYQYRQELENTRLDVLRFHDAIQYTRLEILRLAKDKKIVEDEYKMNYSDLTQARATIEKTRLTCEATVTELRDRVQSEYELTRNTSEELENLRRSEQEMIARDMRDSELVTQLYNLQLRNQLLEDWFNRAKDKGQIVVSASDVTPVASLQNVVESCTRSTSVSPPLESAIKFIKAELTQSMEVESSPASTASVLPAIATNGNSSQHVRTNSKEIPAAISSQIIRSTSKETLFSAADSMGISVVIPEVMSEAPAGSTSPKKATLISPTVHPALVPISASSPRPSLTALLSPMIRSNSLRSPAVNFIVGAGSPKSGVAIVPVVEPFALAAAASPSSNVATQSGVSKCEKETTMEQSLSVDVVTDVLEKIRQHAERSDALQLHLRAVCERCTEAEDLLRMRDLHIDNLNQQVQLLSKTLEQKMSELAEKDQQYHEEVSKASVAAFELSRIVDDKMQLEAELQGEVAKNHELIFQVVPTCQKRSEEAEASLRAAQLDKNVLIFGLKQLQVKYNEIMAHNSFLESSSLSLTSQFDLVNTRARNLENVINFLKKKLPKEEADLMEEEDFSNNIVEEDDSLCDMIELRARLAASRNREQNLTEEVEKLKDFMKETAASASVFVPIVESKPIAPTEVSSVSKSTSTRSSLLRSNANTLSKESEENKSSSSDEEETVSSKRRSKRDNQSKPDEDKKRATRATSPTNLAKGIVNNKKRLSPDADEIVSKKFKKNETVENESQSKKKSHEYVMLDAIENNIVAGSAPEDTQLSFPPNAASFTAASIVLPGVNGRKYYSYCMDDSRQLKPGDFVIVNSGPAKTQLIIRIVYLYEIKDRKMMRGRWYYKSEQTKTNLSAGRRELFQVNRESDFQLNDIIRTCEVIFPTPSTMDTKTAEALLSAGRDQYYCKQSFNASTSEFEHLRSLRSR